MADDRRVYSDEEFALVLRKAAELANRAESPGASSSGLTLAEMKSAAAQAGLDPALIERAARMLASTVNASPLERLTGGPLRHTHDVHIPVKLDEKGAALLLSAVRISAGLAGRQDVGHSSPMGMTWHDGGDTESLSVTARPEGEGTAVSVALDRRGTLGLVAVFSGISMFLLTLFSMFGVYPEVPALGVGTFVVGMSGILAGARGYWAMSTRKVRERIGNVIDTIGETVSRPETDVGLRRVGDGAAAPAPEGGAPVDGEPAGE